MALEVASVFFADCGCVKKLVYGSNLKCSSWEKCKMKQKIYFLRFPLKHYQRRDNQNKYLNTVTRQLLYPSCLNTNVPSFCTHMFATHNTNCLVFILETLYVHWRPCMSTGNTVCSLETLYVHWRHCTYTATQHRNSYYFSKSRISKARSELPRTVKDLKLRGPGNPNSAKHFYRPRPDQNMKAESEWK